LSLIRFIFPPIIILPNSINWHLFLFNQQFSPLVVLIFLLNSNSLLITFSLMSSHFIFMPLVTMEDFDGLRPGIVFLMVPKP
jgi:hypothetical protein